MAKDNLVLNKNIKKDVISLLDDNVIQYEDNGKYISLKDDKVRLYPIEDAHAHRANYYTDTGGVPNDFFQKTSIDNEKAGIRTIWLKPWEFAPGSAKREVVSSIILAAAGKIGQTFNGRDTEVKEVDTKTLRPFLEQNSFYGFRGASVSLGLFLKKDIGEFPKGTLLMVYTFGHPFFGGKKKKYDLEVIRASTLKNSQVRGGATKLFKHFVNNYPVVEIGGKQVDWQKICYYVDYDHNSGNSLPHLGFEFDGYAGPGFMNVTVETGAVTHREPARHKIIMQMIREGKMFSIFNAGVKVFTFTKGRDISNSSFIAE